MLALRALVSVVRGAVWKLGLVVRVDFSQLIESVYFFVHTLCSPFAGLAPRLSCIEVGKLCFIKSLLEFFHRHLVTSSTTFLLELESSAHAHLLVELLAHSAIDLVEVLLLKTHRSIAELVYRVRVGRRVRPHQTLIPGVLLLFLTDEAVELVHLADELIIVFDSTLLVAEFVQLSFIDLHAVFPWHGNHHIVALSARLALCFNMLSMSAGFRCIHRSVSSLED